MDPASLGFKDVVAQALFPSDGPTGFDPIETYGDGNCLFRSMSRILCGNEDMHVELRVRTFLELYSKKELYFDDDFLKSLTGLSEYKKHLLESSFDTSSKTKGNSKEQRLKAGFENGIISTIKPSKYSNMWHIMALANVTGLQINSVYPDINGSLIDRSYMNISIIPEKVQHSDVTYIMWSHTRNTNLHGWSPNHFVPLMPVNAVQVSRQPQCTAQHTTTSSLPDVPPKSSQKRNAETQDAGLKRVKKHQGSSTYRTHFNPKWTKEWPYIVASSNSDYEFRCTVCKRTVSCAKQGVRDVKVHMETQLHINNAKSMKTQKTLFQTCAPQENVQDKVISAEVQMAMALVDNNIQFAAADTFNTMFKTMFPDSEIAKAYSSGRTKTTCMINGALKPYFRKALVDQMKVSPYSLATDGSNDNGLEKMNPLTVRIYDVNQAKVGTRLLDMCLSSGGSAEDLFSAIDDCLKYHKIPWENCIGFGVDNTNVNMGKNNSVMTRVKAKNDAVYFSGCQCHVVHNTSAAASAAFTSETGFDVEDLMVDVFYWFDHSTKRKSTLAEYTEFCDQDYRKILKHVSTRWLSLEKAITRVLKQYISLKSYFLSEDASQARFKRLNQAFSDPMTEVYLFFYQSVLQIFLQLNLFLQKEEPLIGSVSSSLKRFLRLLACKFIHPAAVKAASTISDLSLINEQDYKSDSSLDIGVVTRHTLNKLVDSGDVSNYDEKKFFRGVNAFFQKALQYGIGHMPVDDDLLQNAEFVVFEDRESMTLAMPQYFVKRYPNLLPFSSAVEMEELSEEVNDFVMMDEKEIPNAVLEAAGRDQSETAKLRADIIWSHLNTMIRPDGQKRFSKLTKIALLVLTIPHSNADEERVFSMIRKNKTSFRPSLDLDETLGSIITIKMEMLNRGKGDYKVPPGVLTQAKAATRLYNRAHAKKK